MKLTRYLLFETGVRLTSGEGDARVGHPKALVFASTIALQAVTDSTTRSSAKPGV